jgi:peptide/nickel transport system permease protein
MSRTTVGLAIIGALTLISIFGPLTGLFNPDAIHPASVLGGPTLSHPLGFDSLGRDVLSRLMTAYSVSLAIAVASVVLALIIGGAMGILAGYFGGWADTAMMRPVDMMLAFPALLLAIVLIAILGRGSFTVILAVGLIYTPIFARMFRSSVLGVTSLSFIDAARCRGASTPAVIRQHVLPNSVGPALVLASILAGFAVQIEAALAFIGLGSQPPTPSLGGMLADGNQFLTQAPMAEIFPGLAIVATVAAFLLIGEGLRSRLDPRGVTA